MTEDPTNESTQVEFIDLTHEDDTVNVKQECTESTNNTHQQETTTSPQTTSTHAQLETLRSQLDNFRRENKLLLKEKLEKKTEIRRLVLKSNNLQSENAKLKQQRDQFEKELNELKTKPSSSPAPNLKSELETVYKLLTAPRRLENQTEDDLIDKIKESLEMFNSKLNNLVAEVEGTLGDELSDLEDNLTLDERVVSRTTSLVNEFNLMRESNKIHLEQIHDLEEKQLRSAEKIVTLKEKLDDFKEKLQDHKHEVREFRQRRDTINGAFNREKKERLRLASIVEHYKTKIASLFETIKTKDTSLRSRTDEMFTIKKEKDNLMVELIDKRADLEKTLNDVNRLRRKLDELEDWNDREEDLLKEKSELKKKLNDIQDELTRAKEARAQVEHEFERFKQEALTGNVKLNETVEKLSKEIDFLKNDNGAKLKLLSELNESNEVKLNDTIERLKKEIDFLKSDAQLKMSELSQTNSLRLVEIEETNQKLNTQLDEIRKELANDKCEMSKLREDLAKKRFIVDSLSEKKNDCLIALKREQDLTTNLKAKLQKFDALIKQTCSKYIDVNELMFRPNSFVFKQEPLDDNLENRLSSKRSIETSDLQAQGDTYKRTCT